MLRETLSSREPVGFAYKATAVVIKMIKSAIVNARESAARRQEELIEQLADPVARLTSWTPVVSGGANFCTQKLVEVSPLRLEFRPSLGMKLFSGLFFVIGVGVFFAGGYDLLIGFGGESGPGWFMVPFGLVFGGVGAGVYYAAARPRVFDMDVLWYWKGHPPLDEVEIGRRKDAALLEQVHAIQLIREYCTSSGKNSSSYYSYEINLVMHDGSRTNVIDHGNLSRIRADAERLGRFIGVPVWDATG